MGAILSLLAGVSKPCKRFSQAQTAGSVHQAQVFARMFTGPNGPPESIKIQSAVLTATINPGGLKGNAIPGNKHGTGYIPLPGCDSYAQ